MGTATGSATYSYTDADIEKVVRRFTADIVMIAQSTCAITESKARDYANDVEVLAKNGYLSSVDLTLLDNGIEERAVTYVVNTSAGDLETSRPGGVCWPRVNWPQLRIVLYYTGTYTDAAHEELKSKLKIGWVPSSADTTHTSLTHTGGRNYASNGWGMPRKDYGK